MSNLELLTMVCHEIEAILDKTDLVGGCATELLLTDKGAPEVRYTTDVDMLIKVISLPEYYKTGNRLNFTLTLNIKNLRMLYSFLLNSNRQLKL